MLPTRSQAIFIVEDNLLYQQLIAREVQNLGGPISFFTSGEACLAALAQQPAIIVLDYNLEGEINGLETLAEIRKFDASIYVIMFSSQEEILSRENIRRYGVFNFLEKRDHSFSALGKLLKTHML